MESGEFNIAIDKSSRDIVCKSSIFIESIVTLPIIYDYNSTIGDILSNPISALKLKPTMDKYISDSMVESAINNNSAIED